MKRRKRCFTLAEVLISCLLMSVLLTLLLTVFKQITILSSDFNTVEHALSQQRLAQQRLKTVLSQATFETADHSGETKPFSCFFTEPDESQRLALVFSYLHEPDIQPYFSAEVLGKLSLDKQGNLSLTTWPLPHRWDLNPLPSRSEILLSDVESIAYQFYVPPDNCKLIQTKTIVAKDAPHPPDPGTFSEWHRGYTNLPAMLKIMITKKDGPALEYTIQLHKAPYKVIYTP